MKVIRDVPYARYEETKLNIYLPESDTFSVLVYFHGGGLRMGDKETGEFFVKELVDKNIALVSANYRMYPSAVYPEFIRDAAAAVAWVKNHIGEYGTCEDIYVGGSSAGGYLSMMLCFDKKYLAPHMIDPTDLAGFIHDAGQPTVHFNVMRERGADRRRIAIDEAAPLWHVGAADRYAPMLFIVSDKDIKVRYEQTMLMLAALKSFEYDPSILDHKVMHGSHCAYVKKTDEDGGNEFGRIIADFIERKGHCS